mmetsp:Transcript_52178/g.124352  ORF Transcript_52178/g.124352 Transcript_52178/m.124352 type:complete len:704 (+) Transcript_52178:116-2227(+)
MDDELDQAARKQREKKRLGALQAQQKLRREALGQEAALASHRSPNLGTATLQAGGASSSSASAAPVAAQASTPANSQTAEFKQAVEAKFKELIASGMPKTDAAVQAIRLVREGATVALATGSAPPAQKVAKLSPASSSNAQSIERVEEEFLCPGGPFTCFICVEEKGPEDRFMPHKCSPLPETMCCKACYVAWLESQIDAEAAVIKCCHCDLLLQPRTLLHLVDRAHGDKYCELTLQRALKRDPSFIWCSKCHGGGWVDPTQPTSKCAWVCPECSNSFLYCPFCRREHGSLTCKRFQSLRYEVMEGKTRQKDRESEGAVQRSSKMCPSCKMPIQKDGGCNFMDCPNCRRHFCWSCGRVLKGSHQKHHCDAGFEGSDVVHRTPTGNPCVEFTRLFTNVLDIEKIELLNTDQADLEDLKEMLAPGLTAASRSPLFVGPSSCDGEVMLLIPFNFQKSLAWEITHIQLKASHPPAPNSAAPKSMGLLPNVTSASFSDFDDPTTPVVQLQDRGKGVLVAALEHFRVKGTFRRITSLALRVSIADSGQLAAPDTEAEDKEVFFNDIAFFGIPTERGTARASSMWDDRANLIVSPTIYRRRWGEEMADEDSDKEVHREEDVAAEAERLQPVDANSTQASGQPSSSARPVVEAFPMMEAQQPARQPPRFRGFGNRRQRHILEEGNGDNQMDEEEAGAGPQGGGDVREEAQD